MKVSPSILAAPLTELGSALRQLDPGLISFIHLDIMDGHFVPALTFGEAVSAAVKKETNIPLDVHLMVSHPHVEVPKYFPLKPHNITFHYEATSLPVRLAESIREQGILSGLALNPGTPVEVIEELYPFFDLLLIMTVEPGFYGQPFLPTSWARIERLVKMRERLSKTYNHHMLFEVDGGVNEQNCKRLRELGIDMVVAGSFVFKSEDPNERARILTGND